MERHALDRLDLRELHQLHQRAKALRDRLTSGPKTLAARKAALAGRQTALEEARKALQDEKVAVKKHEHHLQSQQSKSDDLKVKLNAVKKNEEYKAIQNQLALDKSHMDKTEGEILEAMVRVDEKTAAVHAAELEVKKFADEVAALARQIEAARRRPEGPARRAGQGHRRGRDPSSTRTSASATAGPSSSEGPTPSPPSRAAPAPAATSPSPPR